MKHESGIEATSGSPRDLHPATLPLIQDRIHDLRENTDFVSALFESLVGYGIIAADFDGNVLAYNEGAHQIYGYTPEEVIGKRNIETFFPDELIKAGKLQQIADDLMAKGRISYEGEKTRKTGERFPAHVLFTATKDKAGKVVGFIEIVDDLTERKEAETQLLEAKKYTDSIIKSFLDTLIVVDTHARIQTINPETAKLLGYAQSELVGQPVDMVFEEEEEARQLFQFFRLRDESEIDADMEVRNVELTYKAKDGRRIPMSFNASVLTNEDGNVVGVVAGAKDISDIKRAEEERIEQLEREVRSLEELSRPPQTTHTTRMFGRAPLREVVPEHFGEWVRQYGELLELALEQRTYKVAHDTSGELRAMAERIGRLHAGPRDVVEIHSQAVRERSEGASLPKAALYAEEGRLTLLEFMGYLVSHYRSYAAGRRSHGSETSVEESG